MANNNTMYAYKPDYSVHPGEYLEEVLESRGIKKTELAERLNVSEKHISQIVNAHVGLTSELSLQLEKALGISANIWNNMNADYELYAARKK
ncbi:MAG: HigA family addiction module antitoxin [Leptospirales bacterium]